WYFDGSAVRQLSCKVWDFFYNTAKGGFDPQFVDAIHCAANSDFSEITWWFPPIGANGLPTNYVTISVPSIEAGDPIWTYGTLTRTSMIDRSDVAAPLGVDGVNGLIQAHETQNDANGTPMPSWAETGWFMLSDGAVKFFCERLLPDFTLDPGSTVLITVFVVDYPGDPSNTGPVTGVRSFGPFTVTQLTEYILPRCRGYLMKLHFDFSTLGTFARLGLLRAKRQPAGSR
ncbi:MAG: hypothetical protein KGL26_11795, partial [Pseudomonadota bacterium]|nr:hypothetical protein [Pseudomonadota bacterium]